MFSDSDLIHSYTRADALRDGELVDLSAVAKDAGFRYPFAMTNAAYVSCVEWTDADSERKGTVQDQPGRAWDVAWMAYCAIKRRREGGDRLRFSLYVVPREGEGRAPVLTELVCLRPRRRRRAR